MALQFIEGFEIYAADEAELTDGAFLEANNVTLVSSTVRTGDYALQTAGIQNAQIRRALYGEFQTLGMGFAMYYTELPGGSLLSRLCEFNNDNNVPQISVWMSSAGNIIVVRGGQDIGESYTELARTTNSPVITDGWQHFEMQVHLDETDGWYEIRLDGVTVLQQSGINTIYSSTLKNCNQVNGMGTRDVISGGSLDWQQYMDDWFCYDMSGSENNDWIGDRRVLRLGPVDNGPVQDWSTVGDSVEYACVDDLVADGDSTYLEIEAADTPGAFQVELDTVPPEVAAISGIDIYVKTKKTNAGECNMTTSMLNGSDQIDGTDRPISTIYTHRTDMFELDPATGALWEPDALSGALVQVERTA